jgi:CBS domain-containing protein
MRDFDVGVVPVVSDVESRHLVGLITDRDIPIRHVADTHLPDCSVKAHMTHADIETVDPNDDSATVLEAMKRREVRRIPVIDESGKLLGVIAQADIAVTDEIPRENVADVVKTASEPALPAR